MLSVKWVRVVKVPANDVDGALRSLAKSLQNKGNPIATSVAVHSDNNGGAIFRLIDSKLYK